MNAVGRIAGEYVAARTSKSFSRSLTLRFADMVNFTMVSLPHRLLSRVPTRALPRTGRSRTFTRFIYFRKINLNAHSMTVIPYSRLTGKLLAIDSD